MSALEAPATPSTTVEVGKSFIENPAMVPGLPLSSWSASSIGNTSQESPASSTSDDDTDLDIPATQLESTVCQDKCSNKTGHGFFRDLEVEKTIEVTGRDASEVCSFERHGGKRRRALRTDMNSPGYDYERTTSPALDFQRHERGFRRAGAKEFNSPQHKTFIENSQSARQGTSFATGAVNLRHRATASDQGTEVIQDHADASSDASKRFVRCGKARVHHQEAALLDTVLSSSGVALKTTQHTSDSGPVFDAMALEAQKMRDVGITGKEGFKKLMPKLGKIGWRYTNSLVTRLGSNTWIVKPGLKIAEARQGVEKFENPEAVEKYVQDVLRSDTSTSDNLGEEMDVDTHQRLDPDEQVLGDGMDVCQDSTLPMTDLAEDEIAGFESEHDIKESPAYQALQSALESLQPSNAPTVLKQRTEEYRKVFDFVSKSVRWSCGGSLYLCGCPGTGKTQTMTHVQEEVERRAAKVRL